MTGPTPNFNTDIPDKIMTPDQCPPAGRPGVLRRHADRRHGLTLLDHLAFLRGVEDSSTPSRWLPSRRCGWASGRSAPPSPSRS